MPEVSKTLITRWGSDPHVRGSYTFISDGVNGVEAHKALASPLPPKDKCKGKKVTLHILYKCSIILVIYIYIYLFLSSTKYLVEFDISLVFHN